MKRWRLVLGPEADRMLPDVAMGPADRELDRVLEFVYGGASSSLRGKRAARAYLPEWLGALRNFFRHDVIAMVQNDKTGEILQSMQIEVEGRAAGGE